jgi:molybdopterin molybdotransferase
MIPVSEAKHLIREHISRLAPASMPLEQALGLTLSEDVVSPIDIPSFPQSSMDGYAFAQESLSHHGSLTVVGTLAAGTELEMRLQPGQAARIFTGAPLPEGADTVAMQEKCTRMGDLLKVDETPSKGANVRLPGTEAARGAVTLAAGQTLTPAAIGFLSGLGLTEAMVQPMPSVSIIVTGDELQEPGLPLVFGQVYESNSRSLTAALRKMGVERIRRERCPDDPKTLRHALEKALEASDLVLLTGGVSVGDFDYVPGTAEACGVKKVFHRVRQKPGKPLFFGVGDGKAVFGLPGNPASVLTCFYEYVTLAVEAMSARRQTLRASRAMMKHGYRKPPGLTHFLKARHEEGTVRVLDGQESYKLNAFALSDCLVVLEEDTTVCEAGAIVEIHHLPEA